MKKKMMIGLFFTLLLCGYTQTGKNGKKNTELEYEAALNRVRYAAVCGFCFDGITNINEQKTAGSKHSFFTQNRNVFLKVIDRADKTVYYTRCFDIKEVNGLLAVSETAVLYPEIKIDKNGHWNFSKIGKNLNITICTDTACKNIPLPLYETTEKPVKVKDGILLLFKEETKLKTVKTDIQLNAKGLPALDIQKETEKTKKLLEKIKKDLSPLEIKEKEQALKAALQTAEH